MPASFNYSKKKPSSVNKSNSPKEDAARQKLRTLLMDSLHAMPSPAPAGFPKWTVIQKEVPVQILKKLQRSTAERGGDPITLLESLKIFHQYARLLAQACHSSPGQHLPAHAQCLSSRPSVYPKPLEWFEHLASPFKGIPDASHARITQLLKLYAAGSEHSASPARTPAKQAFELARSLPHYDRDLTAFYLISSQTLPANEYELEVAHSILRLHKPPSLAALCQHLLAWRTQGLLHVLTVAVHNMPELADWHLPLGNDPAKAQHIRFLLSHFLTDGVQAIERFIAACDPNSPTDQAFLAILDRLAILMGVKSNAKDETDHSLAQAIASFPHLDLLVPASTVEAWSRLKPALELAIPPSILRVDPAIARKRAKQGIEGTW